MALALALVDPWPRPLAQEPDAAAETQAPPGDEGRAPQGPTLTRGELQRRLERRAQDSRAVVAKRMSKAAEEISHWAEYDYIVVNDDPDRCLEDIYAVLRAERIRRQRQTGLLDFVKMLREGR